MMWVLGGCRGGHGVIARSGEYEVITRSGECVEWGVWCVLGVWSVWGCRQEYYCVNSV